MSRLGQRVRVRGQTGYLSGARVVATDGTQLSASGSWVQTYTGADMTDWDIAGDGYREDPSEMWVPASGIYFVQGVPNLWKPSHPTSGYVLASITKNGTAVASYSLSYQESDSRGSVDEPSICWVGTAEVDDLFALSIHNATDKAMSVGYWSPYICILRIA